MIKAVIIDDESKGRELIQTLVAEHCPDVEIVSTAASADEGTKQVRKHKPDLVFLDIEMPYRDGFDFLSDFPEIDFEVIFTTAFSHYAARAFKYSALDYLMKPIEPIELKAAIIKAESKSNKQFKADQFQVLLETVRQRSNASRRIVLPTLQGFNVVEVKDIIRCEADKNYTFFYFVGGTKMVVSKTLKDYAELLNDCDFMRIHQSHLINLSHVVRYNKGRGGYVTMADEAIVDVSRANKEEFLRRVATVVSNAAMH